MSREERQKWWDEHVEARRGNAAPEAEDRPEEGQHRQPISLDRLGLKTEDLFREIRRLPQGLSPADQIVQATL